MTIDIAGWATARGAMPTIFDPDVKGGARLALPTLCT